VAERPYHHGNLRAALLTQAEQMLREQGVEQLSLRALAREVGVSHGAPRRHFADRQALLDVVAEDGFARLGVELRAAVDGAREDCATRLRVAAAAYVRFAIREPALLELMFAGKQRDQTGTLHEAAEGAFSVLLELIEQGQECEVLERGEPRRVGLLLFAIMQGIATLVTAGIVDREQLDGLVADAIAHFLHTPRAAR
jgi:AcrR family transcriptional regulator